MATKLSYEDACALSKTWVTSDRLTALGVTETMQVYAEKLAEAGWTVMELCDVARERMHARIEELRVRDS